MFKIKWPYIFLCVISILCMAATKGIAQTKYTISGRITSAKTGESLIGVSISINDKSGGTITNAYGFYSLTIPKGQYTLTISAAGMVPRTIQLNILKNQTLDVSLEQASAELQDVMVTSATKGRNIKNTQMGVEHLSVSQTKNIPVLLGEPDIMKSLQLMPGVKSAGEGNSGFYVRGGSADQNLILLDEAPVYNASHLLGFFSTFNSDAIKDVTLYKTGMPAQYGGRLSSVVDIKMNDGNNQTTNVSGGIGTISAKIDAEGPIQKDKSSFLITGRRTYIDAFLKLSPDSTIKNNSLYFYDLNAKLNFTLGDKDRLFTSGYFGKDNLSVKNQFGLGWGNSTATVRWNHRFGNKLFVNTSAIYSNYNYRFKINGPSADFTVTSKLQDLHLKQDWQWYLNPRNTLNMGFSSIHHEVQPGELDAKFGANDTAFQKRYGWENALFIHNDFKATDRFSISYGFRLTAFSAIAKGNLYNVNADGEITDTTLYPSSKIVKTYINPEPRVALSYQLNDVSSLKASYVRNTQNMHLVSNSSAGMPLDRWLVSNNIVKPEISDQYSFGYYKNFYEDKYELTAEAYYKSMQNQIDYRDGADIMGNDVMETQLLYGKGRAYGLEWLLRKKEGRLTGWLSYTLSKSEKKIDGINNNNWYNATQDRRHDIAIVGIYKFSDKWTFSANWIYYTGNAVSFPSGKYMIDGRNIYYYAERNGYRMPAYHRLDLGATLQLKKTKRFSSEMVFSLYNAYGRKNAYIITFRDGKKDPNITEAVKTTLFTFVPSVTYNFKF